MQAWAPNPLEARSALGAGCARLQTIITQCERGDIGRVCFRLTRLSPRLHAGSDAYPGRAFIIFWGATRCESLLGNKKRWPNVRCPIGHLCLEVSLTCESGSVLRARRD